MTDTRPPNPALDALLTELFEQGLSDGQWQQLRAILITDADARSRYRQHLRIHALLESELQWPLEGAQRSADGSSSSGLDDRRLPSIDADAETADAGRSLDDAMVLPAIHEDDFRYDDEEPAALPSPPIHLPPAADLWYRRRVWLVAASVVLAACIAVPIALQQSSSPVTVVLPPVTPPGVAPQSPEVPDVATLTSQFDATWDEIVTDGARLKPGPRQLTRGMARITFDNGAVVTLQAPARFDLLSPTAMTLFEGTLAATVPPAATGFAVHTPMAQVVDLGTEFGLRVASAGQTDLHVLQGLVTLAPDATPASGAAVATVTAGSARRMDERRQSVEIPLEPRAFEFAARADAPSPYSRWMAYGRSLQRDRSLRAYYTFEKNPADPTIIANRAPAGASSGRIENAQWSSGRLPGKSGLRFGAAGDRVKLDVPDRLTNLTLWAWVRIESIDRDYTSLYSTDNWNETGAFHWNLRRNGSVEIGTRTPTRDVWRWIAPNQSVSEPTGEPQDSTTTTSPSPWHLMTTVHQVGRGVRFYVDGKPTDPIQQTTWDDAGFTFGSGQIGNWSGGVRFLRGSIDEFGLLSRAMTDAEVRQLYEATRP